MRYAGAPGHSAAARRSRVEVVPPPSAMGSSTTLSRWMTSHCGSAALASRRSSPHSSRMLSARRTPSSTTMAYGLDDCASTAHAASCAAMGELLDAAGTSVTSGSLAQRYSSAEALRPKNACPVPRLPLTDHCPLRRTASAIGKYSIADGGRRGGRVGG
eukprot:7385225-Prymnesium_polylepis.2